MRTAQLCREFDLTLRYSVFPLHPDTPEDGMSLGEMFGERMDVDAMLARLGQVAEDLNLPFGERSHTYNSRRAQELGKWAELQGQGKAFQDAIYRAYFVDGQNIADNNILTAIAAEIGLNASEAQRVLQEEHFAAAVDADWQRAHTLKVTAVPTLLYGDRRLVGFYPYEKLRTLITG